MTPMDLRLLLLLSCLLSSCFLMRPMERPAEGADPLIAEDAYASAELVLDALASGQDELARRVLQRMRAVHHDEGTVAWIVGVEGVLEGRRLLESLTLTLEIKTDETEGIRRRTLMLVAETAAGEGVVLHMTPPVLRCRRSWLDTRGNGGHSDDGVGLDWLDTLTLPGASRLEFPVMSLDGARGPVAAMRERWDLEMHYCYIEQGGRRFAVNAPSVAGTERYLLASQLSLGPLGPEPLLEMIGQTEPPHIERLVERAVRIPEAEKGAALDQLTPLVMRLSIARTELIAPVLAWLAEGSGEAYYEPDSPFATSVDLGSVRKLRVGNLMLAPRFLRSEPQAWKRWLELRLAAREVKPRSPLELPGSAGQTPARSQP